MQTVREAKVDGYLLRIVKQGSVFAGVVFGAKNQLLAKLTDDDLDLLWQALLTKVSEANPKFHGFPEAKRRFLHFFPNGFHSKGFVEKERAYKEAAKAALDKKAPLAEAANGSGFGEAILAAYRATNLLYPVEKTRLQALLRGPDADEFVRSAASVTLGDFKGGFVRMRKLLQKHDNPRWTVATYLPFLWDPENHFFLKPEVTKDFAARVGHRFTLDYESDLNSDVYESLLDLAAETRRSISDLEPRDMIDVQSFLWTVCDYKMDEEAPEP